MNISQVPAATKVADVIANKSEWNKLVTFVFCVDKDIQTSSVARLYLLVSDGEIIKIGGSTQKTGIKGTLKWYEDAYSGSPDSRGRTLGVPTALRAEVNAGHKVEVYMCFTPCVEVDAPGITSNVKIMISGYKQMETLWIDQYKEANNGIAPILNIQENKDRHPEALFESLNHYHNLVGKGASTAQKPKPNNRKFTQEEQTKQIELISKSIVAYGNKLHPIA